MQLQFSRMRQSSCQINYAINNININNININNIFIAAIYTVETRDIAHYVYVSQ